MPNRDAGGLGNCIICGSAGTLNEWCENKCREGDDLSSGDKFGTPVRNDQTRSRNRVKNKIIVMPDEVTALRARWYEGAVQGSIIDPPAIDSTIIVRECTPKWVLETDCIHHRQVMAIAGTQGVVFPEGNEATWPEEDVVV